ncbi:class I SAM-dependent methyltransferase [Dyadobacter sediminis]|uniref:Class I SAM-dependent methyltransferase n=1 Tax=Dyadobacter sediminis TaxID=1493691 RepID=A0A5R9K9U8_9BACT|nr:class I SAM-dependent methyltransferase [Dyadobacter sediminis]TLU91600.1 class I SAM-dependent methyltransferase [Dyadobacter sediminis]GGC02056.1 methyltransferase [Dyadobacter sediminis]
MKDNFSKQADAYARFRPTYPDEAFDFILSTVKTKDAVWDCGTGNGQLAAKLSGYFNTVFATDISEKQLSNAVKRENIRYIVASAEENSFTENQFDLVTIAQAIHWFNFDRFYAKVHAVLKDEGIIAVIGYALLEIDEATDKVVQKLYIDVLGPYWDKEREYINQRYATIPFPFDEIKSGQQFVQVMQWSADDLIGYLNTWSAVQHYMEQNKSNPVEEIAEELRQLWGNEDKKTVRFPTLLRIGRNVKQPRKA